MAVPIIESYRFGHMVVNGTLYPKDLIIHPDGSILCPWWRKSGHRLGVEDIESLIAMRPEVIVAGTGANGLMQPTEELSRILRKMGMEFIPLPTAEAVKRYNELAPARKTGACFHLTC